jgi:hypothetical protein
MRATSLSLLQKSFYWHQKGYLVSVSEYFDVGNLRTEQYKDKKTGVALMIKLLLLIIHVILCPQTILQY